MPPFEVPFVQIPLFVRLRSGQELASCASDARACQEGGADQLQNPEVVYGRI